MKSKISSVGYDYGERLKGVHPDLIAVLVIAARQYCDEKADGSYIRFTEGVRSRERQKQLVADGKSQTMRSYHIDGKAVDVAVMYKGEYSQDIEHYREFANKVLWVAQCHRVHVTWGGLWSGLVDGPHFQLEVV